MTDTAGSSPTASAVPRYGYFPYTGVAIGGSLLAPAGVADVQPGIRTGGGLSAPSNVGAAWLPPEVRVVSAADKASRPIRRAVWSFWSVPYREQSGRRWANDFSHSLSWILSFRLASQHFAITALVTDSWGYELLVERLGLPFDEVTVSLNKIAGQHPAWWALGKLHAYREQDEPFLHIDNDVFLWPGFPATGLSGDVVAQNPEHAPVTDETYYKPAALAAALRSTGGSIPRELEDYISGSGDAALCTGVVGGSAVHLIRHYADLGIRLVESPENQAAWKRLAPLEDFNLIVEQYLLGAVCWGDAKVDVQCLFKSQHDTFSEEFARDQWYTHLISSAKSDPRYMRWLTERVRQEFPDDFAAALRTQAHGHGP